MKNSLKTIIKNMYCRWSVNKYYHVLRVLGFATILAEKKKLSGEQKEIIQLAAWCHDLGYIKQSKIGGADKHALYSSQEAGKLLKKFSFNDNIIRSVNSTIKTHSDFNACRSLTQKILYDADKLDRTTLGEVIRKAVIFNEKYKMDEIEIFKQLKDSLSKTRFHFKESRRIARENRKLLKAVYRNYGSFLNKTLKILK